MLKHRLEDLCVSQEQNLRNCRRGNPDRSALAWLSSRWVPCDSVPRTQQDHVNSVDCQRRAWWQWAFTVLGAKSDGGGQKSVLVAVPGSTGSQYAYLRRQSFACFGHRGITRLRMDSLAVLRRNSLGCRRSHCVCTAVPAIVAGNAAEAQPGSDRDGHDHCDHGNSATRR